MSLISTRYGALPMPQSLLSFLSPSARAAYPFIEQGVAAGKSANAILTDLQAAGVGIKRQRGLDIISTLRGTGNAARFVRTYGPNAPIPSELYNTAVTNTNKAFSYRVKIENALPGMPSYVNLGSNDTRSVNDLISQVTSLVGGDSIPYYGTPGSFVPQVTFDRAIKNPAFSVDNTFSSFEPLLPPSDSGGQGPEGFGHGL